jgi:hypothetical protein
MTNQPFDFSSLDVAAASEVPFEFELTHPDSKAGLGVFISVIGTEGATFQGYLRREGNEARKRNFAKQRKGGDDTPATIEQDEAAMLSALVVCMTGWRTVIKDVSKPVIYNAGKELEFTPDNALAWLTQYKWVRAQVNEMTGELSNFIKD